MPTKKRLPPRKSALNIINPTPIAVPSLPLVTPRVTTNWRDKLDGHQRTQIDQACAYASRWVGVTNNSPLILLARLADLLDGKG